MRKPLTDLTIQRLPEGMWWDTNLPAFGIRVGKHRKTFLVRIGRERREVTLGHYPTLSLKDARSLAKTQTTETTHKGVNPPQNAILGFLEACGLATRPSTLRVYRHYLDLFDLSTLPPSKKHIEEVLSTLNPPSANLAHATLRTFLNWCLEKEYIDKHPLVRSKAPHRLKSRERVLSDDELAQIWSACTGNYGNVVRILILTAARREEVNSLTVSDVLTFTDTKNGTTHVLPLTPLVKAHLPVQRITAWSYHKRKLDSGVTDWRLHDLRRTAASKMQMLGIRTEVIERILNHTVGGVRAVYQRYGYWKEMEAALLTYERRVASVVDTLNFVFSAVMTSSLTDKQSVVLNYCLRLMIVSPRSTIFTLIDLLENGTEHFTQYIARMPEMAQRFFASAFRTEKRKGEYDETKEQILRRLYSLLENPVVAGLFSSPESRFNIGREMDAGNIILISTDRSLLKPAGCAFLGRFFLSQIAQAMEERGAKRVPTQVFIDELGDYLNSDDTNIRDLLEKGRKRNVGMTLAHQQLSQIPAKVYNAIITNCSTKFVGNVSESDFRTLSKEIHADTMPDSHVFLMLTGTMKEAIPVHPRAHLLERAPQRTKEELNYLVQENRAKYTVRVQPKPLDTPSDDVDW